MILTGEYQKDQFLDHWYWYTLVLFNISLNDLLLDNEITDICNFEGDNILYKGEKHLEILKTILTEGVKQVSNPEMFQLLLIGPKRKIIKNDL